MLALKIPPVAVALAVAGFMWAGAAAVPKLSAHLPNASLWAGGISSVGVIVAIMGVLEFRRAKTTVNPLKPEAVSEFVASGIYRVSRNPMYLGMLLVLIGWAVLLRNALSLVLAAGFIVYMNRFQIVPEERFLVSRFGEQFTSYCSRVRRWL